MSIDERVAGNIHDYLKHSIRVPDEFNGRFMFRGVPDVDKHLLVPAAGRQHVTGDHRIPAYNGDGGSLAREKDALEMFKIRAHPYVEGREHSLLELMFHAQHHGLPTRLLDWTFSPLTALFFALNEDFLDVDGAVYVFMPPIDMHLASGPYRDIDRDPFSAARDFVVTPKYLNRRIAAQQGCFTLHVNPKAEFNSLAMYRIRLPRPGKPAMLRSLDALGVRAETLTPDLVGVATSIKAYFYGRVGIMPP